MKQMRLSFLFLMIIFSINYSQEVNQSVEFDLGKQVSSNLTQNIALLAKGGFNFSVNEEEYLVDAGDVFLIKIDVKGPAINIFQTIVTPDGMIVLPNTPSLKVTGLNLKEAKQKIFNSIKGTARDAEVEVYLFQLHSIIVSVIGAVYREGRQDLLSASRLFDAIQIATQNPLEFQNKQEIQLQKDPNAWVYEKKKNLFQTSDSLKMDVLNKISWRNIEVIRNGKSTKYDLLRFRLLGDMSQNPYLMNGDLIKVPFIDASQNVIEVSGLVGNPTRFEFREGDDLRQAISFAGGLLPYADSSRIDLFRFRSDQLSLEKIVLDYRKEADFKLMPDDRILVRNKALYRPKYSVEVIGEVRFPGKYPIIEGSTTLKEIIKKSGGFSSEASLALAKIVRRKYYKEDFELRRLVTIQPTQMTTIEWSYYQSGSKEDLYVVNADFQQIFNSDSEKDDILLRDLDIIIVPRESKLVYLSGAVVTPGTYAYTPGWSVADYIQAANGYARRARKGELRVVKEKTGNWLDISEDYIPGEGDKIFVPIKFEKTNWDYVKEGLTVLTQFATIVAVIFSINRR